MKIDHPFPVNQRRLLTNFVKNFVNLLTVLISGYLSPGFIKLWYIRPAAAHQTVILFLFFFRFFFIVLNSCSIRLSSFFVFPSSRSWFVIVPVTTPISSAPERLCVDRLQLKLSSCRYHHAMAVHWTRCLQRSRHHYVSLTTYNAFERLVYRKMVRKP